MSRSQSKRRNPRPTQAETVIVVYVEGGVVSSVRCSHAGVKAIIYDHDNIDRGDPAPDLPNHVDSWPELLK